MWKKPSRPNKEISQTYNDGIVRIYAVSDDAAPGYATKEKLTPKGKLRYENRRVGIQRYYSGMQNQARVDRVIRCPKQNISTQDIAVTEDGQQYRVDLVQLVPDVYPSSVDVTLSVIKQVYEVTP